MDMQIKGARSAGFALALICFLLPFVTLSCPMGRFSFTGAQMALGTTVQEPQAFGPPRQREIPPEPLALAAAGSAAAGVIVGLVDGAAARLISSGIAVVGGASLFVLKNKIETETRNQTFGLMMVTFELGYWLGLVGYGAALMLNLVLGSAAAGRTVRHEAFASEIPAVAGSASTAFVAAPPQVTTRAKKFCTSCGETLDGEGVSFCDNCGTKV